LFISILFCSVSLLIYLQIPAIGSEEFLHFLFTDDADIDYYELYDIQVDPNELHNLYGKPGMQKVEKEMKKLLATYRRNLKVDE
jgi:hypothetical protein